MHLNDFFFFLRDSKPRGKICTADPMPCALWNILEDEAWQSICFDDPQYKQHSSLWLQQGVYA